MRVLTSNLAESCWEWRNPESPSATPTLGKRAVTEVLIIPSLLTVALVESAIRGVFVVFSYLDCNCGGHWGSVDLFKTSLHQIPIMGLALIDNFHAKTLDKDNGCLIGAYAKCAFHEDQD